MEGQDEHGIRLRKTFNIRNKHHLAESRFTISASASESLDRTCA